MKSIGIGNETPEFFRLLGFDVDTSTVECCGMAGSFGYKKQYYDLSKNLGHELGLQIENSKRQNENCIILASGTSCREQIADEIGSHIQHPVEYLNLILRDK